MGVFDFIKDAGAKVGIGKSRAEEEAELKAKGIEAMKANAELMQRESDKRARDIAAAQKEEAEAEAEEKAAADAKAKENAKARLEAAKRLRRKAEARERFSEHRRSKELEAYVGKLGLQADDLDVRFDDGTAYITGEAPDQATREKIILAIGNAEGVAKVQEEITVAKVQEPEAVFHTVVSGDTLWAIADKVYGDGNRYPEIFEANKPMLSDPDLIFPGQVLRCPK